MRRRERSCRAIRQSVAAASTIANADTGTLLIMDAGIVRARSAGIARRSNGLIAKPPGFSR